jgi:hypothetical protein
MELIYEVGRDRFLTGTVFCAYLRASKTSCIREDSVILAQIFGMITLDYKWARQLPQRQSAFFDSLNYPEDNVATVPVTCGPNSHIIFQSSREVLRTTQLNENGIFMVADLPEDLLPSYKGLSGAISYYLLLTIQVPGDENVKQMKIPFKVVGSGSTEVPYGIRHSNLLAVAAGNVPIENLLLPPLDDSASMRNLTAGGTRTSSSRLNGVVYNIHDKAFVCSLSMISRFEYLEPGSDLVIHLDFEGSKQTCRAVSAYIRFCEARFDGSRVHEKVIVLSEASTIAASTVNLSVCIPLSAPSSFQTPLFNVSYQIGVDFFLESDLSASHSNDDWPSSASLMSDEEIEPLTWLLPVDCTVSKYGTDITAEMNACLNAIASSTNTFT